MSTVEGAPRIGVPDDADTFGAWIAPHWPTMASLAQRLAARGQWEDALQNALSLAWRNRAQFDASRGPLRSWLLTIVANESHRSWRTARDQPTSSLPGPEPSPPADPIDLDLKAALAGLTDRQRLATELYYFVGLSTAEVADAMSCSVGTVKSTLSDARQRLRTLLGEDYR